jgi:hypothetical protein
MLTPDVLRHVIEAATLAPSVHNTQPWRFVLREDGFDLHADRSRQLAVLDPAGRQLTVSCGAALAHAEVAARAVGLDARVALLPDDADPDLLARVQLVDGPPASAADLAEAEAMLRRHTSRAPYAERPLPPELLEELRGLTEAHGAMLRQVRSQDDLIELEVLLSRADTAEERDPEYRAELTSWLHPAESGDGIPPEALDSSVRGSSLRLRDFTLSSSAALGDQSPPAEHPAVVVLTTPTDVPEAWLRAGQALARLLVHAAGAGVQAQPLGQVTDLPQVQRQLAQRLGLVGIPQLVLRLGYVEAHAATPRRPVDEVLDPG